MGHIQQILPDMPSSDKPMPPPPPPLAPPCLALPCLAFSKAESLPVILSGREQKFKDEREREKKSRNKLPYHKP